MPLRTTAATIFLIVAVLITGSTVFAEQIEMGTQGTGVIADVGDDNSCFLGGLWEGDCTTDYQWNAGWYHIRLIRGEISYNDVPDTYKPAMPSQSTVRAKASLPPAPPGDPDTDGDGVTDSVDLCPAVFGLVWNNGCPDPDTDGDGVPDSMDSCPAVFGLPSTGGCPDPDTDGDGVTDSNDMCIGVFGDPGNYGCPASDSDFDGIPDGSDACPLSPAPPGDADGCPDEL